MEHWRDQAIVLHARSHGEGGAIVSLLSEHHGRHAGFVHGALSERRRALLQGGSRVQADWQARTADNLGTFTLEPEAGLSPTLYESAVKLAALKSACALCHEALPEREGHPGLYHGFLTLIDALEEHDEKQPLWAVTYLGWELAFLRELGFPLALHKCAGGGDAQTLTHISPKSGRAVSAAQAAPYKEKLLPLPNILRPEAARDEALETGGFADILVGLDMTGYFLEHWAFTHHTQGVPMAREAFVDKLSA